MLKYWLWLTNLPGLTNQSRLALLRRFDSPEEIYCADREELLLTEGLTREQADRLADHDLTAAERTLAECQRLDLRILTIRDGEYPGRLKNIYDPPVLLYLRGRLPALDDLAAVAVVGTRNCTPYGESAARKFGYGLAAAGAVVVTGLARGIDSCAARGALFGGGPVVAVLGNGLDVVYPGENRYLYEDVAAAGALLSEYPPGTRPEGRHFPVRNRILSGLSVATLVVEAPERSGALITAETALEQGRDVFAVPGPIDAENSRGCNRLIRDGAGLAAEAGDILREYAARFPDKLRLDETPPMPASVGYEARRRTEAKPVPPSLSLTENDRSLTDDQIALLRALDGEEPILVDDLIEKTGIPARRVLSALTVLELENLAAQHSGKRYTRTVSLSE